MAVTFHIWSYPQGHIAELLQEHFSEHADTALSDPLLYGDYRTALQPEMPRLYEDIQDYDAAKGLFDEVRYYLVSISI